MKLDYYYVIGFYWTQSLSSPRISGVNARGIGYVGKKKACQIRFDRLSGWEIGAGSGYATSAKHILIGMHGMSTVLGFTSERFHYFNVMTAISVFEGGRA